MWRSPGFYYFKLASLHLYTWISGGVLCERNVPAQEHITDLSSQCSNLDDQSNQSRMSLAYQWPTNWLKRQASAARRVPEPTHRLHFN